MTKSEIAKLYIQHLENGEIEKVIELFSKEGIVHSPLYGSMSAKDFYVALKEDTTDSKLKFKGVFEEPNSNRLALYFNYIWTLQSGKKVDFDVVDINVFNDKNKIAELKII